ncbi:hypothetical protein COLO4_28493 [Corchorus olitorius]|uniref:DUF7950 domain-containing protein n=1 Tax=Corchorus olitorius TaxID=93759 RepID=A0A1R3HK55_9ROSI|nr:hypothetical protein COLO4_28493 [Corchorus olitorius]
MSRYRPIAPKPEMPSSSVNESSGMSSKIRQSPYLRNLWPQLQARPTRTRKRGRAALSPPTLKRARTTHHVLGLSSPSPLTSPAKNLALQGFSHGIPQLSVANFVTASGGFESCTNPSSAATPTSLVTLPLLPCPSSVPVVSNKATIVNPSLNINPMERCGGENKVIDLNMVADVVPEEKDLLKQLQGVVVPTATATGVIAPQPIRPVGSSISVKCINEDPSLTPTIQVPKKPEEVEEEVESEALPAVISDSNNKIRLANSAYKEMVGQPECPWLDSMVAGGNSSSCKRICGEVMLHLSESRVPVASNGFSCWVRIEWGSQGKKNSISAFCDVMRLSCQSKDYLFTWRFHTRNNREASQSSCNV